MTDQDFPQSAAVVIPRATEGDASVSLAAELHRFLQTPEGRQALEVHLIRPVLSAARAIVATAARLREPLIEFLQGLARFQQWFEEAPEALRAALVAEGAFPHPGIMTLHDLNELIVEFRLRGPTAAVERLHRLHEELFADTDFRSRLKARWEKSRRWAILEHILRAHDAELYCVSVPAALAQAEGIVVDAMAHTGMLPGGQLRAYIAHLRTEPNLEGLAVDDFASKFLFAGFTHGSSIPRFSRHAILHGADTAYGTKRSSLLALVWVDYLLMLSEQRTTISPNQQSSSPK